MKVERVLYRLSILVILVSGLGGVCMSTYSHVRASDWQEVVDITYGAMNKGYADCEEDRSSLACELILDRREAFENAAQRRSEYQDASRSWLKLSLAVPLAVIFLFYSLGWAVTGKVRPLRIDAKNDETF